MRLELGDCLEIMPSIPDGSVDLILCDLPYGTTACKWDSVIPFEPLWAQYRRIAKRNAAIVLTASQPFTSALVLSAPDIFKYALVWEKASATGVLDCKFRPLKAHEDIAVFSAAGCSNGSKPAMRYEPQMTEGKPYSTKRNQTETQKSFSRSNVKRTDTVNTGTRYPRSVMRFANETGLHPTQKPVALMEYLIRTYTNEGETVLDNCMGSGTTGVACANTGRNLIGIERDDKYLQIS
jgi:site-specific DNA-methyltransferase (adenine-specific)